MEKIFKPFDLQKAIAGEWICDTVGNRVKFLVYEPQAEKPIACLFLGKIYTYTRQGHFFDNCIAQSDLRMAEEVNESLCCLLKDDVFLVDGRAGRLEAQAKAIYKVLGM
jgi:hypothetical protein